MKIRIVDNGPKQENPFLVLSAENSAEKDELKQLLNYQGPILVEADPGFKVSVSLTRDSGHLSQRQHS